jgi:hypothetical protein
LPPAFFKDSTKALGMWYQFYLVLTGLFSAAIIWYLWTMKYVGLYLYFASYMIHNIVAWIVGNWLVPVLIIPVVGSLLLLPHGKKMTMRRKNIT